MLLRFAFTTQVTDCLENMFEIVIFEFIKKKQNRWKNCIICCRYSLGSISCVNECGSVGTMLISVERIYLFTQIKNTIGKAAIFCKITFNLSTQLFCN